MTTRALPLLLSVFLSSSPAFAQPTDTEEWHKLLAKLGCDDVDVHPDPQIFNDNAKVRLEGTTLCVDDDTETAWFLAEAAAMDTSSYIGYSSAPWLNLQLRDQNLEVFWSAIDKMGLVEVPTCAGYNVIIAKAPYELVKRSDSYSVQMGNAEPAGTCPKNSSSVKLVTTIRRIVQIATTGGHCPDCPPEQQELLDVARKVYSATP